MAAQDNGIWLGLLKWSLAYQDGTRPSEESLQPMSEEKRKFLEAVMKDGIIDEGKRMRAILAEVTLAFEPILNQRSKEVETNSILEPPTLERENEMLELLLELQDIVEQIDYARDFMKIGGIPFLLGCASDHKVVPISIRTRCLGILATMAQNNPPVQDKLLVDENGLSILGRLFFENSQSMENDADGKLRVKVLHALSCAIRGHDVGEESFCQSAHLRSILDLGLGAVAMVPAGDQVTEDELTRRVPPSALRKKSLFLLRALVTSDTSSRERVRAFSTAIKKVVDTVVTTNVDDVELVETSVGLLVSVLRQKKSVNTILDERNDLVGKGITRVAELRKIPEGEDKEYAKTELDLWESLIVELSRCERDVEEQPMMLAAGPENPSVESLPQ